eukprot:14264235-Alexandrium_andersonii.AAC.1
MRYTGQHTGPAGAPRSPGTNATMLAKLLGARMTRTRSGRVALLVLGRNKPCRIGIEASGTGRRVPHRCVA